MNRLAPFEQTPGKPYLTAFFLGGSKGHYMVSAIVKLADGTSIRKSVRLDFASGMEAATEAIQDWIDTFCDDEEAVPPTQPEVSAPN